jgi:DNA-directed RNA polymerase subunit RPC12/RpoP
MMPNRTALVRSLDRLFSQYIRQRDGGKCVTCGRATPSIQCGHVIHRGPQATRWDERNAGAQCPRCNEQHEVDPHALRAWCIDRFGEAAYVGMMQAANKPADLTIEQLENLIREYRQRLGLDE